MFNKMKYELMKQSIPKIKSKFRVRWKENGELKEFEYNYSTQVKNIITFSNRVPLEDQKELIKCQVIDLNKISYYEIVIETINLI